MTTAELLSHLRRQDIKVWADNGQVFCNGPKGALTSDLQAQLIERKQEILAFLSKSAHGANGSTPRSMSLPVSSS